MALHFCSSARADDYAWKNTTGGLWGTPSNWTPTGVPTLFDNASIPDLTPGAGARITLTGDVAVNQLVLGRLSLIGDGDIVVSNLVAGDTGFTIRDSTEILLRARQVTFTNAFFGGLISTSRKFINIGVSTNFGRISAGITTSNQMEVEELPRWINETHSQLWLVPPADGISFQDITVDPSAPAPSPLQFGLFENERGGIFGLDYYDPNVSGRVRWTFNNFGTIHVKQGNLSLEKVGYFDGDISVDTGSTLTLTSGGIGGSVIGTNASFAGFGTIIFKVNPSQPYNFLVPQVIPNPVVLDHSVFNGEEIDFFGLVNWNTLTGTGFGPIVFLGPSTGTLALGRHVMNFGLATDKDIHPLNGAVWENMSFSQFIATADANSPTVNRGWLTNNFMATVDFSIAFDREWNIHNLGLLLPPRVGKQMRLKGSLLQDETGELRLNGGTFTITNQLVSAGMITGFGAVTAAVAQVSGIISPKGSNSIYGKISIVADTYPNLTFNSNTVFQIDIGNGTNDQIYAQSGKFRGRFDITAQAGFGPGDYTLAKFAVAVPGPFRLGMVPFGYRYQLSYPTGFSGEVHLIVSLPPSPVVTLRSGVGPGSNSFSLDLNTLTDVPYVIEYTDHIGGEWQLWTNFIGDGQFQSLSPLPTNEKGFFKVTEGTGNY